MALGPRLIAKIERTAPILWLAVAALIGILLTLSSVTAHVNSVYFPQPGKLLGFWHEINWSVNYAFVIPLAIFFALATVNSINQVIRNVAAVNMIVRADGSPVGDQELIERYHKAAGLALYVVAGLSVLALLSSLLEWHADCLYRENPLENPAGINKPLLGWNLAASVPGTQATFVSVRMFGLAAFTSQAAVATIFFMFCVVIITFAAWIYHYTSEQVGDELIPNVRSPDPRRGFEHFEPFIRSMLLAALFLFGVFFLTRLDGAFVLAKDTTLWDFVKSDILFGFASSAKDLIKNPSQFFYVGSVTEPIVKVALAMALTIMLSFVIPVMIVGMSARDSRARARVDPLRSKLIQRLAIDSKAYDHALDTMTFWPLKYPTVIQLLTFITVAGACFVFFRLTLILVGLIIAVALKKVYSLLTRD
jgi:hypothetical protein